MTASPPFSSPSLDARQNYRSFPGSLLATLIVAALAAYAGDVTAARDNAPGQSVRANPKQDVHPTRFKRGRVIAIPRAGVSDGVADQEFRRVRGRGNKPMRELPVTIVELPSGVDEVTVMQQLRASGKFASVELDAMVEPAATVTDPNFSNSWGVSKIGAPEAWDDSVGEGVTIAILDTGVNANHPDLAANMVPGWNTYDNNSNSADVHGHGTLVAGAAAMVANNGTGSAGVAHRAKIMPIRISDTQGYGYSSTIAAGIYWAADHGARVANASFAGIANSAAIQQAATYMRDKGGVVVIASGNESTEAPHAEHPDLIAVGATDRNDVLAKFSTRGDYVDMTAPGVSIYTSNRNGSYSSPSGTSLASPIVAGVAALMFSANPGMRPHDLKRIMFNTALDLCEAGRDKSYGHGRVRADLAVAGALSGDAILIDTVLPSVAITSPAAGNVSGVVAVNATASDDNEVAYVEFYVGGGRNATVYSPPYSFNWDTTNLPVGNYYLSAKAFDSVGNSRTSEFVLAKVGAQTDTTKPTVSITAPTGGSTVSGTVSVTANAADNVGVSRVEFFINGALASTDTSSPYAHSWNTSGLAPGNYTLSARAFDAAGNQTTSGNVSVSVPVPSDTTKPTVSITSPTGGSTVSGTVSVTANAADNVGVSRVEFFINGVKAGTDTTAPFSFSWGTSGYADGDYTLTMKAFDAAGNTSESSAVAVTVDQNPGAGSGSQTATDTEAPVITFFKPLEGTVIGTTLYMTVQGTDNVGIVRIEVLLNGSLLRAKDSSSLQANNYLPGLPAGQHTVTTRVYDDAGNVSTQTSTITKE